MRATLLRCNTKRLLPVGCMATAGTPDNILNVMLRATHFGRQLGGQLCFLLYFAKGRQPVLCTTYCDEGAHRGSCCGLRRRRMPRQSLALLPALYHLCSTAFQLPTVATRSTLHKLLSCGACHSASMPSTRSLELIKAETHISPRPIVCTKFFA